MFEKLAENIAELVIEDENFIDFASYPLRGKMVSGNIILKSNCAVLSGSEIVVKVLKKFSIDSEFYYTDGDIIYSGANNVIAKISGDAYNVLICERTVLNVLSFMSSVATKVRKLVEKAKQKAPHVKIAATRKTIPFSGELQKIAIIHGGGDTHRLNLSDCAMIKDNHIKLYGSVANAIRRVKENLSFSKKIEVEVENEQMALEACECKADIIMLDNFPPELACKVAEKIKKFNHSILVEVSGGIDPDTIESYLCEYIDIISLGKITSEVKYIDFSLELI